MSDISLSGIEAFLAALASTAFGFVWLVVGFIVWLINRRARDVPDRGAFLRHCLAPLACTTLGIAFAFSLQSTGEDSARMAPAVLIAPPLVGALLQVLVLRLRRSEDT